MDLQWTLLAGFLVFFMQVGFAMLETGMVRAKNVTHTMAMNVVVFCPAPSASGCAATPSSSATGSTSA